MLEFFTSQFGVSCVLAFVMINVFMGTDAYCIYFERKISAWAQDRIGPNRVGPLGLLQPIADGLKFLFKEDIVPRHVDRALFILAPGILFLVAMIGFAAIPWGGSLSINGKLVRLQVANPDIGLLYVLGVASMSVYGVVLGGWASDNKYSLYGAIRAAAQMLSYEIPMGLCILVIVLTMGSLRLESITLQQTGYWAGWIPRWNIFLHPLAFVILITTLLAESNRTPFDLAEAEQELVGGYHTEYGALKFGMFFLGEYSHMITGSAFISVLFLGGWHFPWFSWTQPEATQWYAALAKFVVLFAKVSMFIFFMMWIRWTLPRFRFDQLMHMAWKGLIPVSLTLFGMTVVLLYFKEHLNPLWCLGGNAAVLLGVLIFSAVRSVSVSGREPNLPPMSGRQTGSVVRKMAVAESAI